MFTVPNALNVCTISVEPGALHNGFRYQVPTDVLVPVEGHQIQAAQRLHVARMREPRHRRRTGRVQRHRGNQAAKRTGEGKGAHYRFS